MALIQVDHHTLREVSAAITDYCAAQDRQMRSADSSVKSMLNTSWSGFDAHYFSVKWEAVDAKDSTAVKFRDQLSNFASALKASADVYQRAQEDVYDGAAALPRYIRW